VCAISGVAPENPVISKVSGYCFERSVLEKHVEATGRDPVSGEAMEASDVLPIKVPAATKPRPVAAASIPGMLALFQNEWDALMLELYNSKQQLETVRQELGHALYQHEAACRVIARVTKERDDARQALVDVKPAPQAAPQAAAAPAAMDVDTAKVSGMTPDIVGKFEATSKTLSKGRKKRQPPADQASAETIGEYTETASHSVHKAGPVCVDAHMSDAIVASGGKDGKVNLIDASGAKALKGHTGQVTRVRLHPTKPLVVSCSTDNTLRVWSREGKQLHCSTPHTAEVTDCTLHATGEYCVTASRDKSWALSDLNRGECVLSVKDATAGYACAGFHPDGLILGTGTAQVVRIWDIKSQNNVASFEGHEAPVTCLTFSENGYYLATGAEDSSVKLWDLRKLKNFQTLAESSAVRALHFDYSCGYLAVGSGKTAAVYESKTWSVVKRFGDAGGEVTGVAFGKSANSLTASSADGIVKQYAR